MGLTDEQYLKRLAALAAMVPEAAAAQPKPGIITEDATIGNEERIRGIPAVGRVSGTIKGTRPGDDAKALEQAGRDILRAHLNRTHYRKEPT
jgi:hypothetical protein